MWSKEKYRIKFPFKHCKIIRTIKILKTLQNHWKKMSVHVNVRASKMRRTLLKVAVCTYATYAICRTLIFSWWCLLILMVSMHTFKRAKNRKFILIGFSSIAVGWYNKTDLASNIAKWLTKILPMTISISWPSYMLKWFAIHNKYSNMYYASRPNSHHDVAMGDSDVDWMVD